MKEVPFTESEGSKVGFDHKNGRWVEVYIETQIRLHDKFKSGDTKTNKEWTGPYQEEMINKKVYLSGPRSGRK